MQCVSLLPSLCTNILDQKLLECVCTTKFIYPINCLFFLEVHLQCVICFSENVDDGISKMVDIKMISLRSTEMVDVAQSLFHQESAALRVIVIFL